MDKRAASRWASLLILLPLVAGACGLPGAANEHERKVLVDYHFDQYAAVFAAYFPKEVTVHPGDTVVFKQSWSGEPHTVTLGTAVDEAYSVIWKYLKDGPPYPEKPPDDPAAGAALKKLDAQPQAGSQTGNQFAQQGAQPCYVESGPLPKISDKPCASRTLKPFTGRQAFYNSGVIPYEGDQGNTFRLAIAADASPGTHYFHCLLHGPLMSGALTIAPPGQAIPSQESVNAEAQKELSKMSDPFAKVFKDGQAHATANGNLAGLEVPHTIDGSLTEFVPRNLKVKAHQKVTWRIVGDSHTVSFNVPKYLPEISFAKDGTVSYTDQTINPVAGPGLTPPDTGSGGPPSGGPGGGGSSSAGPPPPPPPIHVDAGDYDGKHFLSSGLGGPNGDGQEVTYSITFTTPGTYKYACLVHPQMVGEVVVQ